MRTSHLLLGCLVVFLSSVFKLEAKDFRYQSFDNQILKEVQEFNFNETLFAQTGKTVKLWLTDHTIEKGILKSVNSESLILLKDGIEHQIFLNQITKAKRKNRVGKIVGITLKVIGIIILVIGGGALIASLAASDGLTKGLLFAGGLVYSAFGTGIYYIGKALEAKKKRQRNNNGVFSSNFDDEYSSNQLVNLVY
ncbi:MAG: hypothetical protein ACPGTG_00155 [Flavobacteriales bacterium]